MLKIRVVKVMLRVTAAAAISLLVVLSASAQTVRYIHTDGLGSVVLTTDKDRNIVDRSEYEPYGSLLNRPLTDGPGYTGHVMDATTGLTYMQQRYYDQSIGRFLSSDPVSAISANASFNRYRYANNNPYKFRDPDGRNAAIFLEVGVPLVILATAYYVVITPEQRERVAAELDRATKELFHKSESANNSDGNIEDAGGGDSKPGDAFPDRPLPRGPGGEPIPDPDAQGPHTQLGRQEGRKGPYPQAREFDGNGKPVRDIDFTDHGRPNEHTNPHEHRYVDNPTGGTPQRGPPRPLPEESKK